MKRAPLILTGLLIASGCGEDAALGTSTPSSAGLTVRLDVGGAGVAAPCRLGGPVEGLRAWATPSDGAPSLELAADCAASRVDLSSLPRGVYDVEVRATGFLRGRVDEALYAGAVRVQVPGEGEVLLRPEVAFIEVDWRSTDEPVDFCAEGVDAFRIEISAEDEAETPSLMASVADCAAGAYRFDRPVRPGPWHLRVRALNGGMPRFDRAESRILDAGANLLDLSLEPTGVRLFVDWTFAGPSGSSRGCDIARVERVELQVSFDDERHIFEVPCAAERPRPLEDLRVPFGAMVEIEARAEGAALYRATSRFSVESDRATDRVSQESLLMLEPFGRVDVPWTLVESCAVADTLALRLADAAGAEVYATTVRAAEQGVLTPELPFGAYALMIEAVGQPACGARLDFEVDAAYVALPDLFIGASP